MSPPVYGHWCVLIWGIIAGYISKSYEKALEEWDSAEDEFDKLDSTTSDEQRAKWASEEAQAHADRLSNVKAMDIYLSKLEAGQLDCQMMRYILTGRFFQHPLVRSLSSTEWKKSRVLATMSA